MGTRIDTVLDWLTTHPEPLVRWKTARLLLALPPGSEEMRSLRQELANSPMLQQLLADRKEDGRISFHPYDKWFGSHWILSILADLGYPQDEPTLKPLLDQ